jgi:translocation and assembly module TamB
VLARDEVTAAASGKVSYKGPLLAGVLEGNLAMWNAAIHLESTGVPEVPLLRSFAALKADTFDAAATSAAPAPMTLDLSLSMADPMTVEGRGLDSAWRGDLYVTGSFSQPMLVGGLAMERGTFGFVGQTFELESGTVTFTGGGRIDPQLNVVAVREVTGITVTVNVSGSASAPTITLSSRPALPQDEVLARLLFNRNMSELGPLESIQLASAAADMSGLARGGISGVVRRALNLDTFSFGGQSGNAVVVGRQIGRNIFASVEQNVNNTNRVFTITWRLSRQFSLRSSARDQTGANFGVFWRKDY